MSLPEANLSDCIGLLRKISQIGKDLQTRQRARELGFGSVTGLREQTQAAVDE